MKKLLILFTVTTFLVSCKNETKSSVSYIEGILLPELIILYNFERFRTRSHHRYKTPFLLDIRTNCFG